MDVGPKVRGEQGEKTTQLGGRSGGTVEALQGGQGMGASSTLSEWRWTHSLTLRGWSV